MTPRQDAGVANVRPSATVVVLRDHDSAPEVLLVKRRAGDAFGDSYAFPGGVVDPNEADAASLSVGANEAQANATLGIESNGLDYYSAAIRELFEETGILLARDKNGEWANCDSDIGQLRTNVDKGLMLWTDFLRQRELLMAFDALHYFAHWVTPLVRPKRWTTRFFLAGMPPEQSACHDGVETTDSRWISANDALREQHDGSLELPYPTMKTLQSLREFGSIGEMTQWADERQQAGIQKIRPDHVVIKERK